MRSKLHYDSPQPCVVCGRPTMVAHHRIPFTFFKRGKVRGNANRNNNRVPLCSPPQYLDSCHALYDSIMGQMPYMGSDRHKRTCVARNVAKLIAVDERFINALPPYAIKAYKELGGDE